MAWGRVKCAVSQKRVMKYVHIGRRAHKLVLSFFLCLFVCLFIFFKNIQCHFRALSICFTNWSSSLWYAEPVMSPKYSRLVFLYLKENVQTAIENEDCFQIHIKNMVRHKEVSLLSRFHCMMPSLIRALIKEFLTGKLYFDS